jgi:hypothetical protein
MVLLTANPSRENEQRIIAQTPSSSSPALPSDFAQRDWGLAIGICVLVGVNLWQMVKGQLTADNDLQKELVKSLLEERKLLLAALLERKP